MSYEVIPSRFWVQAGTGRTASVYGCKPNGDGWEIVTRGWTVRNPNTNEVGAMQKPWATQEAAQAWADTHKPNTRPYGD
jgi:hypothetical protein